MLSTSPVELGAEEQGISLCAFLDDQPLGDTQQEKINRRMEMEGKS